MKTTKILNFFKLKIFWPILNSIDNILIIGKISTSSIQKHKTLTILIFRCLHTTILIRLDYVWPILKSYLSYEVELSLRLTSALYSIISIFISIIIYIIILMVKV